MASPARADAQDQNPVETLGRRKDSKSRNQASKYDYVKVKVWLGAASYNHYYVLSRFLLSRMLTVIKIPHVVAVKIALELKKLLVDHQLLDVSQPDLESFLFKVMLKRGYGEDYVHRYRMVTEFHHQRVPLVILIGGVAAVGKSTIASQLSQRLNLPNVLHTELAYDLLRNVGGAPLNSCPLWRRGLDKAATIEEYSRECRVIRKAVHGELVKCLGDGKPIIMEGLHLDSSLFDLGGIQMGGQPPVLVSVVLEMERGEHKMMLSEWLPRHSLSDDPSHAENELVTSPEDALESALDTLQAIQSYVVDRARSVNGLVLPVSPRTFSTVLDQLHEYILYRMEEGLRGLEATGARGLLPKDS